jgi:hypothetical protein
MKIKLIKTEKWNKWPDNSIRFLLPVIAVRGFWPNYGVSVAFWKYRQDISIRF